jgi:hypothetical protein
MHTEIQRADRNTNGKIESTSKVGTGAVHKQESRMPNYSRKGLKVLGSGRSLVKHLDGLQTENEDIARNYGS